VFADIAPGMVVVKSTVLNGDVAKLFSWFSQAAKATLPVESHRILADLKLWFCVTAKMLLQHVASNVRGN
jgi:hypothetical protein